MWRETSLIVTLLLFTTVTMVTQAHDHLHVIDLTHTHTDQAIKYPTYPEFNFTILLRGEAQLGDVKVW